MKKAAAAKSIANPLLPPILESFEIKRKNGLVAKNWLLILLRVLDAIRSVPIKLQEDDIYTYDYTLTKSRTGAIRALLKKYGFPPNLGMSDEGVTVRGAPALRIFRYIDGGGVIADRSPEAREALILEAIELVRAEVLRIFEQKPIELLAHQVEQTGIFVAAILQAVENRSQGRVEQALVGAKLQLRFPDEDIPIIHTFAGDRQTKRDSDYQVGNIRVIVSATPKDNHFKSAALLADQKYDVMMIVTEGTVARTKTRIKDQGYRGKVTVLTVDDYVTSNMKEIAQNLDVTAREMCLKLIAEYNRRAVRDNDISLQVVLPIDSSI